MVSTMSDGWKFEQVLLRQSSTVPLGAAQGAAELAAELHITPSSRPLPAPQLQERLQFLSGVLVSFSKPSTILPSSCISSHIPGPSTAVLSRKIKRAVKKCSTAFWEAPAPTAPFAAERPSDRRNPPPAAASAVQPVSVSGPGVTEGPSCGVPLT